MKETAKQHTSVTTFNTATILLADDDEDDRKLIADALRTTGLNATLQTVEDGQELIEYLRHEGRYPDSSQAPFPFLVLLDLNMPVKDGREALAEIKADPRLRRVPVVVLTTSEAREDVQVSYDLGVNSFITKPTTYAALVQLMDTLGHYWMHTVQLPVEINVR